MPGRFPLVPVALTNDPFCEDGYCVDGGINPPPPSGNAVFDYCVYGDIALRVYWTRELYSRRYIDGALYSENYENASSTFNITTCTVWLATKDLNYPAAIPDNQPSFPPVGYFSPRLYWDVPTGMPNLYTLSRNGILISKRAGTNTTNAYGLYGSNVGVFSSSSYEIGQNLYITKIELRENVAGLGVIGDDVTAQGLILLPGEAGGLPYSQTFTGPATAIP